MTAFENNGHLKSTVVFALPFKKFKYENFQSKKKWDKVYSIDSECLEELNFWKYNLDRYNGFYIKSQHVTTKIVYSDASEKCYGGYIVQRLGNIIAEGNFEKAEIGTSSTYRELLAVKNILSSFAKILKHEQVLWYSDNFNVLRIIEVGSTKPHLQALAVLIFNLCIQYDIKLEPSWIPRKLNTLADELSKYNDTDDWKGEYETFSFIQSKFGTFTVDRFADNLNKKVAKFNSKFFAQ